MEDGDEEGRDGDTDDIVKKKRAVRKRNGGASVMKDLGKGQMVLDAGQAIIGSTTCKDCGMLYSVDAAEDVKAHKKYHNEWIYRFEIPKTFTMQLLHFYNRDMTDFKVYFFSTSAEESFKKLISKHVKLISEYLGYSDEEDIWTTEKRIFCVLALRGEHTMIGGILIIEKIEIAYTNVTRKEIRSEGDVNDWIVGVDRLWVDPSCRGRKVSYSLLDAATTMDREMEFRKRRLRLAFSDPTDDGMKVAKRFIETRYMKEDQFDGEILVY